MSLISTKHALTTFRKMFGDEGKYHTVVMGSLHNQQFKFAKQYDWAQRGAEGNANWKYSEINSGKYNLVVNLCCEHMAPMSGITLLDTVYLLQSNNRYSDTHINRITNIEDFLMQIELTEIIYYDICTFEGVEYYTVIGEKLSAISLA